MYESVMAETIRETTDTTKISVTLDDLAVPFVPPTSVMITTKYFDVSSSLLPLPALESQQAFVDTSRRPIENTGLEYSPEASKMLSASVEEDFILTSPFYFEVEFMSNQVSVGSPEIPITSVRDDAHSLELHFFDLSFEYTTSSEPLTIIASSKLNVIKDTSVEPSRTIEAGVISPDLSAALLSSPSVDQLFTADYSIEAQVSAKTNYLVKAPTFQTIIDISDQPSPSPAVSTPIADLFTTPGVYESAVSSESFDTRSHEDRTPSAYVSAEVNSSRGDLIRTKSSEGSRLLITAEPSISTGLQ